MKLSSLGKKAAWLCAVSMALVWWFTSIYMSVATFAYFCLIIGIIERKKTRFHMRLMTVGITTDIITVLILEITRSAVGTATAEPLSAIQYTHIICSLIAVLIYLPTFGFGFYRAKNPRSAPWIRKTHIICGVVAFALRSVGWLTMFSLFQLSTR